MIEAEIRLAGREKKIIQINYVEKDGSNDGWREVEPYSIKDRSNNRLLYAWDVKKEGMRSFILESILGIKTTSKSYSPRFIVEL